MKFLTTSILSLLCFSTFANAADFNLRCEVKKLENGSTINLEKVMPVVLEQKMNSAQAPGALINMYTTDQSSLPFDITVGASQTNTGVGIQSAQVHLKDGMFFSFRSDLGSSKSVVTVFSIKNDAYRIACSILE